MYKSDQEPAIIDLKRAAVAKLKTMTADQGQSTAKVDYEESPVGQSQANSLAERAIWEVEGMTRTLVHSVEGLHKIELPVTHPARLWAIEYAAQLLCRFARSSSDGRTPYELRRGRAFKRALPAFCEPVLFLSVAKNKRRQKHEDRWKTALYLGLVERSNELRVGNINGVFKVGSIKRLPIEQRVDPELVKTLRGTPWQPTVEAESSITDAVVGWASEAVVPEEQLPPDVFS